MAKKYYAVKIGLKPGIYTSWDECSRMVKGYSGAVYKSFTTENEALAFLGADSEEKRLAIAENVAEGSGAYAFVDGSYNIATRVYGYGGFLIADGKKYIVTGSGSDAMMAEMRNVAGEILGSMAAVRRAIELGLAELDIYYDYMGIEMWATGAWKRNKKGTMEYYDFMQSVKDKIKVNFVKVKGHSGIEGNEEADMLAKKAAGILPCAPALLSRM